MLTNFLELRVEKLNIDPTLRAICAGFEAGEWRSSALSKYLIRDCLLDFALTYDEKQNVNAENAGRQLAEAAVWLYNTSNYKSRGEIGELLLHVVMKQFYSARSIIAKIYFKDSSNDTVKGFDSVHVSGSGQHLELWLGEVKFYSDLNKAVRDVTAELRKHLAFDYLKAEFTAIRRKLQASPEDEALFLSLTEKNVSLDTIVRRICVPVLLTYDSDVMINACAVTDTFKTALKKEVEAAYAKFQGKLPQLSVRVHLCLFPLGGKTALSSKFHEVLLACQMLN